MEAIGDPIKVNTEQLTTPLDGKLNDDDSKGDTTNTKLLTISVEDTSGKTSNTGPLSPALKPTGIKLMLDTQKDRVQLVWDLYAQVERNQALAQEALLNSWEEQAAKLIDEIRETHDQLERVATPTLLKDDYFTKRLRQTAYKVNSDLLLSISMRRQELAAHDSSKDSSTGERRKGKLPEIKLPTFNGSYADWPTFKEMFQSLVLEDTRLSDVERLHYLQGSLSGKPKELILGFPLVGSSLQTSWDTLIKRYENRRFILATYLDQFQKLAPAQPKHPETLNQLISSAAKIRSSILSLCSKEELADCLIVHQVSRLLDRMSSEAWETSLGDDQQFPSFEKLEEFLVKRVRALERVDGTTSNCKPQLPGGKSQQQSSKARLAAHSTSTSSTKTSLTQKSSSSAPQPSTSSKYAYACSFCDKPHYVVTCEEFKALPVPERRKFVANKPLCYNCLGKHAVKACKSQVRCKVCNEAHHTMIHLKEEDSASSQVTQH